MSTTTINDDIRALSPNEIESVTGGAVVSFGPLNFFLGDPAFAFGISITGVGGAGITNRGGACGVLKGVGGGCVGH
jgi:hypothetical protein